MRIRRRPAAAQPSLQLALDPTTSTAPQTPQNAARNRGWLAQAAEEDREAKRHAGADLAHKSGVARRLALPQDDDDVVAGCGMGAQRGADDGHLRFGAANGHHRGSEEEAASATCNGDVGGRPLHQLATAKAEKRATSSNSAVQPALGVAAKDEGKKASSGVGAAAKKRRGPAVLLEGSRCSRVNGRGWRCSQPTLVGYSLCEHHLGKGRMRSAAAAARGRLGRTEHGAGAGVSAAAATAAPETAEGPIEPAAVR